MAIDTYQSIQNLIISRLYTFNPSDLETGGTLEFLREYADTIANTNDTSTKAAALSTLRNDLLDMSTTDIATLDLQYYRNLADIYLAVEIGAMENVQLDGVTPKTIAATIGFKPLASGDTNLIDAINRIGDISQITLDGTNSPSSLVAAIGTGPLVTTVKTDLISAINSLNTMGSNIIVSDGLTPTNTFYACISSGLTPKPIAVAIYNDAAFLNTPTPTGGPTTSLNELLNGWVKCIAFANQDAALQSTTASDSTCANPVTYTSSGDALSACLGTIIDVLGFH